jgi:hypothetical protein
VTVARDLFGVLTERKELDMSVAATLGVDDIDGPEMARARQRWDSWAAEERPLAAIGQLLDFRSWTRTADVSAKDEALRSLAKLGSASGDDDPAAITALTWVLVPGASLLAHRMVDLATNIDELVAGHLWIAARTFAWDRRRCTAASILRDTLRSVQAELGVGEGARRQDRVWTRAICVDPFSPSWLHHPQVEIGDDANAELLELLEAALSAGVITAQDEALLIELAAVSDEDGLPAGRGRAGLMTPSTSDAVALRWGLSSRTIRRRAGKAIDSLKEFSLTDLAVDSDSASWGSPPASRAQEFRDVLRPFPEGFRHDAA